MYINIFFTTAVFPDIHTAPSVADILTSADANKHRYKNLAARLNIGGQYNGIYIEQTSTMMTGNSVD